CPRTSSSLFELARDPKETIEMIRFFLTAALLIFPLMGWALAEPLDFNSAVNTIISRSTGIAIQEASLGATRFENLPIRFSFLPSFTLSAQEPISGTSTFQTIPRQVYITSQWNLFRWGSDYLGILSADAQQDAQKFNVATTL